MRSKNLAFLALVGGLLFGLTANSTAQTIANDSDGSTPLHHAVRANDLKTVDALIKRGADVKAMTRYGVTPIGIAAMNGNAAILRRLIDAGASPNTATPGVGSSRVDLQACKLEYSIVSPK